jgi:hypothetical protein
MCCARGPTLTRNERGEECVLITVEHYQELSAPRELYKTANAEETADQLRAALRASVQHIRQWHGMGIPAIEESYLWQIYWENSPEMKPIREILERP